jgi:ubiquinone/menaquinone biosynthesis C-methylase UbiE
VSGKIEWLPADMQALPFESASFDCVVAQFGVMLAPDKMKAFSEARRVLSPGGAFLFSVWPSRDAGPSFFRITVQAVQKYAPIEMAANIEGMSSIGHSLSNTEDVCNMLRESGFSSSKFTMAHVRGISSDLLSRGFIIGSPITSLIPDNSKLACMDELKFLLGDNVDAEAIVYEAFV